MKDTKKFIDLLYNLVKIESVSQKEEKAVNFLKEKAKEFGMQPEIDKAGNIILTKGNKSSKNHIIFLGHIDTVKGGPQVRIEDGILYGRGSVDAKGPLCAAISAFSLVELPADWKLTVVGAVCEETNSKGAKTFLKNNPTPPNYCIIGEPSGIDGITIGYRGSITVKLEAHTTNAHSSTTTETAPHKIFKAYQKLLDFTQEYNKDKKGVFNKINLNLNSINSFDDGDITTCKAILNIRIPPSLSTRKILDIFNEFTYLDIEILDIAEPYVSQDKNNTLIRAFKIKIREAGLKPKLLLKGGTSDMNIVAPLWKCQTVAYGPGDSKLDHTPNEHIKIEDYLKGIKILQQTVEYLISKG